MATADLQTPPDPDITVPDGYELLDGKKVRKPVSEKSCWVAGELLLLIGIFLKGNPIGRVYPGDTSFRCFPGRPRRIRKPDVAFVRGERIPAELSDRDIQIRPDLVASIPAAGRMRSISSAGFARASRSPCTLSSIPNRTPAPASNSPCSRR